MNDALETHKKYANKKLYGKKFDGENLAYADLRGATLCEASFKGCDLSHANLEGAQLYRADFADAICYETRFTGAVLAESNFKPRTAFGATFSMNCNSFENIKVTRQWWLAWVYFALLMKPDDTSLIDGLKALIGAETLAKLDAVFQEKSL